DVQCVPLCREVMACVDRYLAILKERRLADNVTAPAFVHPDGRPIDPPELRAHLSRAQRTRLSVEFNAAFCRGLLKTRYEEADSRCRGALAGPPFPGTPSGEVVE